MRGGPFSSEGAHSASARRSVEPAPSQLQSSRASAHACVAAAPRRKCLSTLRRRGAGRGVASASAGQVRRVATPRRRSLRCRAVHARATRAGSVHTTSGGKTRAAARRCVSPAQEAARCALSPCLARRAAPFAHRPWRPSWQRPAREEPINTAPQTSSCCTSEAAATRARGRCPERRRGAPQRVDGHVDV